MKSIAQAILISTMVVTAAYGSSRELCRTSNIPIPIQTGPALFPGVLDFVSKEDGSGGSFRVHNQGTKAITAIFVVVELLDRHGTFQLAMPFVASTGARAELFQSRIPTSTKTLLEAPAGPGEQVQLVSHVQWAVMPCPAEGRISAVRISFDDRTHFEVSDPNWRVRPTVRTAAPLRLQTLPVSLPVQATLVLQIGPQGRVSDVRLSDGGQDTKLQDWFRSQLSTWSFNPELNSGGPIAAEVKILFRIRVPNSHNQLDLAVFQRESPILPIDVFFSDRGANSQSIFAGGEPFVAGR